MELDKDVLLIYLNDLRTAETIIYEYEGNDNNKVQELENKKNSLVIDEKPPYKPSNLKEKRRRELEEAKEKKASENSKNIFIIVGLIISMLLFWVFAIMGFIRGGVMGIFVGIVFTGVGIAILAVGSSYVKEFIKDIKDNNENVKLYEQFYLQAEDYNYNDALKEYEEKLKEYNERIKRKEIELNRKKEKMDIVIEDMINELREWKTYRSNLYDLNIIPLQFRNIEGIYYLYDYLSTSNETLTNALMQANLDSIKKNLEMVIALQGQMIIQQAQTSQVLFMQNQQILEHAQSIEANTAIAAKYSQISAINSEMSLKLQAKQLAYQKADFWLK